MTSIDKIKAVIAEINEQIKCLQTDQYGVIDDDYETFKKLTRALDIAVEGFKEIYADGSYEDIASEISEKAINKISEILEVKP